MDHVDFSDSSFVRSIGEGGDVPLNERRFLLIPVEGCAGFSSDDKNLSLEYLGIDDFGEDYGWKRDDWRIVGRLGIGQSILVFDGIAQVQTVVRTF